MPTSATSERPVDLLEATETRETWQSASNTHRPARVGRRGVRERIKMLMGQAACPRVWPCVIALPVLCACGTVATVGSAIQVTPEHHGWAEITSAAVAPGENASCPNGRLFFASAENVVATDLAGNVVSADSLQIIETPAPAMIYDNHLVKMNGGVLVHTVEGITWRDLEPKPDWWDLTAMYSLNGKMEPGGRANIWVYRSADCGATWQHASDIDAAVLEVDGTPGYCGHPSAFTQSDNGPTVGAGGWDAHLLAVDHLQTRLFLTTVCIYGVPDDAESLLDIETQRDFLVLRSDDGGGSWSVVCHRAHKVPFDIWRVPVTTFSFGTPTPSEWVSLVEYGGSELWLERFPINGTCQVPPADTIAVSPINLDQRDAATKAAAENSTGAPRWDYASQVRLGDNATVSIFDWIDNGTRQGFKIARLGVDPNALPTSVSIETISPASGSDLIHGTLVQGPPGTSTSVFYYAVFTPGTPGSYQIGFRAFDGVSTALSGLLSVDNAVPYA